MASETALFDELGLPWMGDVDRTRARMEESFGELFSEGWFPWSEPSSSTSDPGEELRQCTGLPTPADIFGGSPCLEEWAEKLKSDEDKTDEEDDGVPWWIIVGAAIATAGWIVWGLLDEPVSLPPGEVDGTLDGFEIDGIPWTVDRMHHPKEPRAARVAELMLHGGKALPGPGSHNVNIGGRGALTAAHAVAACPMPNVVGLPHLPQPGSWKTTNTSVYVNGQPLLRTGDWVLEMPGGLNPIVGGMPTVFAGPQARSCMVQEVHYLGLDTFVDGLERVGWTGAKLTLKGTVSWNLQDVALLAGAAGLLYVGGGIPLVAPVAGWGAKKMVAAVDGPEIKFDFELDMGTLFGETRKDFDNPLPWGPERNTTRERYEFDVPGYKRSESAELDPAGKRPPTKKDETSEWESKSIEDGPTKTDDGDVEVFELGPARKRTQTHDAEKPPKPWNESEE